MTRPAVPARAASSAAESDEELPADPAWPPALPTGVGAPAPPIVVAGDSDGAGACEAVAPPVVVAGAAGAARTTSVGSRPAPPMVVAGDAA
jgi:hypothetical protein